MTTASTVESGSLATVGRSAAAAESLQMRRDDVIRLEKPSDVGGIQVRQGMIWLTGTPAQGDVVLPAGEQMELPDQWPFVIQALEGAEICLIRVSYGSI